jgi:CIC family chloride channel protein
LHALSRETIYTLKLTRRGVRLDAGGGVPGRLDRVRVAAVMEPMPEPVAAAMPIGAASRALWLSANGVLPVMGADERYHGCVTARAIAEALGNPESADRTAGDLATMPPKVTERSTLVDALHALAGAESTGLPVLDPDGHTVTGWITHRAVLTALQESTADSPTPRTPVAER